MAHLLSITNCSLRWYSKKRFYGLQEELNEISFSRFLEQVDSKIWRLHLQRIRVRFVNDLKIHD